MDDDEFAAVLVRARDGDEAAFAAIYHRVQPGLLRYLRGLSIVAADDLASEAWLEVVRGLDGFAGDKQGFNAWIFTIARRKAIDRSRYEARRPITHLTDYEPHAALVPGPATLVEQADGTDAAIALVRTLPPDQAEAILLRVVAGLDIEHVAKLLGKSNGAVRILTHRGLRRLGATLAHQSVREDV